MTNKEANDEIDLIESLIVIWKKKWNIILIIVISMVLMFFFQTTRTLEEKIVTITSKIRPISVTDEAKYRIYNSFLNELKPNYLGRIQPSPSENIGLLGNQKEKNKDHRYEVQNTYMEGLVVNNINKQFLYDLFIDRLNQKPYLTKMLKEFNFIKRENYSSNSEYDDAVLEIVSSIKTFDKETKLTNQKFTSNIKFTTNNIEGWENFLEFIEKETNIQIQNDLSEMINNYLKYSKELKKFTLEDIDIQLLSNLTENEKIDLENIKKTVESEKYVERVENVFSSSPISNSDNFYAAKIIYDTSKYIGNNTHNPSIKKMLLIAGVFGLIFGIFYALISNAIQNRIK